MNINNAIQNQPLEEIIAKTSMAQTRRMITQDDLGKLKKVLRSTTKNIWNYLQTLDKPQAQKSKKSEK